MKVVSSALDRCGGWLDLSTGIDKMANSKIIKSQTSSELLYGCLPVAELLPVDSPDVDVGQIYNVRCKEGGGGGGADGSSCSWRQSSLW